MTGGRASELGLLGGAVVAMDLAAAWFLQGVPGVGAWALSWFVLPTLVGLVGGVGLVMLLRGRREQRDLRAELQQQKAALQALQATVHTREVEQTAAAAGAAEQLDALASLIGDIAHDFNNLLTAVLQGSELIGEKADEAETVREVSTDVRDAAIRAAALTGRLMAFGRRRAASDPDQVVDLAAVIRAQADGIVRLLGDRSMVGIELAPALPSILASPVHLEQVLGHLCANAREAMPDGGRLTIQAMHVPSEQLNGLLPDDRGAGAVCLRVQDTGVGIPPDHVTRIFEPWFTTKDPAQGRGLGLGLVQHLVSAAGGVVRLGGPVMAGAVFEVYWPVHVGEPALDAPPPAEPPDGGGAASDRRSRSFLVIDDDAGVRELVSRGLRARGHTVVETADGDAAERAARTDGSFFDVILSDIDMPGRSGVELVPLWAELMPSAQVILMTGSNEYLLGESFFGELAVEAVLRKPFDMAQLEVLLSP